MNVNLGGIIGLLAGAGIGLLVELPVDYSSDPDAAGRAGKMVAIFFIVGAFAGNLAWAHFFGENNRRK
jgi:hypothetical protein